METCFYFFIVNARSRGATIPVTWANVTSDTGRFFDSRLSNMRRAAIRRAGASRSVRGGMETDTLLLNCKKISSIRALSIARGLKADLTNQIFFIFLIFKWYSLIFQMSLPLPDTQPNVILAFFIYCMLLYLLYASSSFKIFQIFIALFLIHKLFQQSKK